MNPYEVLEISKTADQSEIKKAYRKLALENHPDHGGDEENFKQVNEAYSILSDEQKRIQYDTMGNRGSFDVGDFFRNFSGGRVPRGFADIFGDFGKRQPRNIPREMSDEEIVFKLKVSLADLKRGIQKVGAYKRPVKCLDCEGEGGEGKTSCAVCQGSGMRVMHMTPNLIQQTPCQACGGNGISFVNRCKTCNGAGINEIRKKIKFEIKEIE